ncbi:MAG: hypothetical protein IJ728_02795 [Selenomonadaceae bacterium]|nr:hypothetical protein [Selenomonadaceae bacterium]
MFYKQLHFTTWRVFCQQNISRLTAFLVFLKVISSQQIGKLKGGKDDLSDNAEGGE